MRLLLVFILLPLVELFILLKLADLISGGWTFALVVVTGIIGATLARRQGWGVIERINRETAANQLPTTSLMDGLMILIAGALLITPGILTDLAGFSLLVPACRRVYRRVLLHAVRHHVNLRANVHVVQRPGGPSADAPRGDTDVIEGKVIDSYVVSPHDREGT